jgi:hypothetical protein
MAFGASLSAVEQSVGAKDGCECRCLAAVRLGGQESLCSVSEAAMVG